MDSPAKRSGAPNLALAIIMAVEHVLGQISEISVDAWYPIGGDIAPHPSYQFVAQSMPSYLTSSQPVRLSLLISLQILSDTSPLLFTCSEIRSSTIAPFPDTTIAATKVVHGGHQRGGRMETFSSDR